MFEPSTSRSTLVTDLCPSTNGPRCSAPSRPHRRSPDRLTHHVNILEANVRDPDRLNQSRRRQTPTPNLNRPPNRTLDPRGPNVPPLRAPPNIGHVDGIAASHPDALPWTRGSKPAAAKWLLSTATAVPSSSAIDKSADATGILVEEAKLDATVGLRADLGLDALDMANVG